MNIISNLNRKGPRLARNLLACLPGLMLVSAVWAAPAIESTSRLQTQHSPQITGLWYDPASDGQGFNLQTSAGGLFGFYYGYGDETPLWLIFDTLATEVEFDQTMVLDALMPLEGVFGDPVEPTQGGVGYWGTLTLRFDSCTEAYARLDGLTGSQEFDLILLAGLDGFDPDNCTTAGEATPSADASGTWFEPETSGQGWNLLTSPAGTLGFFYGYDQFGDPRWLVSSQILDVTPGIPVMYDLLSGNSGNFNQPTPPQDLDHWGTVEFTFADCRNAVARMAGTDGAQVQQLQMLANVPGLEACEEPDFLFKINDTGIRFCGAAANGNFSPCDGSQPQGQDANWGRDALDPITKIGGGAAGFDFTKISNDGQPLPASAELGTGPEDWACTRDNVTGLVWEVKSNDIESFRYHYHRFSWYDSDSADGNPGSVGTTTSCGNSMSNQPCNIENYKVSVNAEDLCGIDRWRLPNRTELESIVHYGSSLPAIDTDFFEDHPSGTYWTGLPRAAGTTDAWAVLFGSGGVDYYPRSRLFHVRLVHSIF